MAGTTEVVRSGRANKGAKPGERRGGRAPGTPNKVTNRCREAIALIAEDMGDDFRRWLFLTAAGDDERGIRPDPKGAAELYLKAIEYHIPKLSRVEATGLDGKDLVPNSITVRLVAPNE